MGAHVSRRVDPPSGAGGMAAVDLVPAMTGVVADLASATLGAAASA
uniref:Uncharacterized protein n=1 Tax=Oryza sativa subsp. japonica TaxID=39947 RepID=Q2R3V5_ORYSJ|nr:hypothetical protein LOC_Os11g30630 [Oryza sativa Japonica Group]